MNPDHTLNVVVRAKTAYSFIDCPVVVTVTNKNANAAMCLNFIMEVRRIHTNPSF